MKKIAYFLAALSLASCAAHSEDPMEAKLGQYATVSIGSKEDQAFLSQITDNGKEVLNLYRFAAIEADNIYWQQVFGDKALLEALPQSKAKDYALLNYGPWDRIDGSQILPDFGAQLPGAQFYPAGMTAEQLATCEDTLAYSPYSIISEGADGKLIATPYHEAYEENITKICNYLKAASDITIIPSVKDYLLAKIEALRSDDYTEANAKWLAMDSKMDLVIGPNEVKDDRLMGLKKSWNAYVLLKDAARSEEMAKFAQMMPELQQNLPCEAKYKAYVPDTAFGLYAMDALYYAGYSNAGVKEVALSLPTDSKAQKVIVLENVAKAKFNKIINPLGTVLLDRDHQANISSDAFLWNCVFRELAHGLGVKETLDGRSLESALGRYAIDLEDTKAVIMGMYLSANAIRNHQIGGIISAEDEVTTSLLAMIRGCRFGLHEAIGTSNAICYNYLKATGALARNALGQYFIDTESALKASEGLISEILKLQAEGTANEAKAFVEKYAKIDEDLTDDFRNIKVESIPLDVRYTFDW